MKLLEAEPTPDAGTAAAPPAAPAGDAVAARACGACGAPMQAEQDWCLSCGTAAPGRLGQRPGWRAAATIAALTLVLVAGSVAAAYAALTTDATQEAAAPAPPAAGPVAQAPPATPPSSATPPPPKPLPAVKPPPSPAPSTGGTVTPVSPPATPSPAPAQPVTPVTPPTGSGGSTQADTPPEKPAGPVMIELPGDAGSVYDPDTQAVDPGDPSLALDGEQDTAFDVAAQSTAWGVGYVLDLQSKRGLRAVRIDTDTPGFKVEVYATDLRTPPPSITDTRWAHLRNAADVGTEKGRTTVRLSDGTEKYRTLLLWITAGPAEGDRVDLSEVTVLG